MFKYRGAKYDINRFVSEWQDIRIAENEIHVES
jgi:hypothetical protein